MSFEGILESLLGCSLLLNSSKLSVLLLFDLFDFLGMSVCVLLKFLMKLRILD